MSKRRKSGERPDFVGAWSDVIKNLDMTSCDFTNGCVNQDCDRCYPPTDPRDAEERSWREVWSTP